MRAVMQHWRRLSRREQGLLLGLALFIGAVLAYSLIGQPTRQRLHTAERQYQQQRVLAAQLAGAQPARAESAADGRPLSLRISERASAAGLHVEQMEVDDEGLELTLAGEARAVLQWLAQVEREGATLHGLTLEKREDLLQARLQLR